MFTAVIIKTLKLTEENPIRRKLFTFIDEFSGETCQRIWDGDQITERDRPRTWAPQSHEFVSNIPGPTFGWIHQQIAKLWEAKEDGFYKIENRTKEQAMEGVPNRWGLMVVTKRKDLHIEVPCYNKNTQQAPEEDPTAQLKVDID